VKRKKKQRKKTGNKKAKENQAPMAAHGSTHDDSQKGKVAFRNLLPSSLHGNDLCFMNILKSQAAVQW
jgi:2',3'-cyclic-nucleotide 2'-phosphodiesterase (5'-nucleotidase family)